MILQEMGSLWGWLPCGVAQAIVLYRNTTLCLLKGDLSRAGLTCIFRSKSGRWKRNGAVGDVKDHSAHARLPKHATIFRSRESVPQDGANVSIPT